MTKDIRPIRIEGDVAYVPLTRGYEAVIDAVDVPLVAGFNWYPIVHPRVVYALRTDLSGNKKRTVLMHRAILGEPEGMQVDHKDTDGLNNRRNNLREATVSQNQRNRRLDRNNTSGYKGVAWHKVTGKWQARITLRGESNYLGVFDTPQEAHAAYVAASAELHGEFGRAS